MNELDAHISKYFEAKQVMEEARMSIFGLFPRYLREQRVAAEITQDDLAKEWGVGIPYISKLETGANVPSERIMKLYLQRDGSPEE